MIHHQEAFQERIIQSPNRSKDQVMDIGNSYNQPINPKNSWNIISSQTPNHKKKPSNVGKVGAIVIYTCLKSSINSRIQKFGRGNLEFSH